MTQIQPFNPENPEIRSNVAYIMMAAPVRNLTEAEVQTTLRLLQLQVLLRTEYRGHRDEVVVRRNDPRLELCDDGDRFLAMLLDCDLRDVLLGTKRCRSCFGGTVYHWRRIARKCPITDTASALSEYGDGGYYGRGWVIADNIRTLRKWIVGNSTNEQIRSLNV